METEKDIIRIDVRSYISNKENKEEEEEEETDMLSMQPRQNLTPLG